MPKELKRWNKMWKLIIVLVMFLLIGIVHAADVEDSLGLSIQTTDDSGDIITGTFNLTFNITNQVDCSNVLYTNTTQQTTDSRGLIFYTLENVNLNFSEQYYLCYYRNGSLISNTTISRSPYAFTTKTSNSSDCWDNMGSINSTQMEDSGGILNILESWFTTFWNAVWGTKTTDDLTEGSTNKYYNQTDVSLNHSSVGYLTTETDPTWSANFTNMQIDCPTGNYTYGIEGNGTLKCRNDEQGAGGAGGYAGVGPWLYNDSTTIHFNETHGNESYGESIFWNKTMGTYNANFSAYVGTGKTGYEAGNEICSTNFTGTHLCDWNEVKRTYDLKNVSEIVAWTGSAWVAGGPSKYTPADYFVNDCHGFTDASGSDSKGNAWSFNNNKGLTGSCGSLIPLACCKAW